MRVVLQVFVFCMHAHACVRSCVCACVPPTPRSPCSLNGVRRLYEVGFTEKAGNFQSDNFRRGGKGGDPVLAEAQDGNDVNNANFAIPPDGLSPRMVRRQGWAGAGRGARAPQPGALLSVLCVQAPCCDVGACNDGSMRHRALPWLDAHHRPRPCPSFFA